MPIHDWKRVSAGTFHHFHLYWIGELGKTLNSGLLPPDYYAMAEQSTGPVGPDVVTLHLGGKEPSGSPQTAGGGLAVADVPPRVQFTVAAEQDFYVEKQRTLVIRHTSGDRVVALIELVSPGNKKAKEPFRAFVEKASAALRQGIHLLVVDLFPPTRRDPQGIHGAIWAEFDEDHTFVLPPEKRLTLAAYSGGLVKNAYIQPVGVGDELPDMPLFLTPDVYVPVPLEATYRTAFAAVPHRWQQVLEA